MPAVVLSHWDLPLAIVGAHALSVTLPIGFFAVATGAGHVVAALVACVVVALDRDGRTDAEQSRTGERTRPSETAG